MEQDVRIEQDEIGVQSLELLNGLEELVSDAKKTMFGTKVSINREEALQLIEELRGTIPDELLRANEIYKRSREFLVSANGDADKIIADAHDEADTIIRKAQEEASAIVSDAHGQEELILQEAEKQRLALIDADAVTVAARAKAEQLLNEAYATEKNIHVKTKEYMDSELKKLSDFLANAYKSVEKNREEI